MNVYFSLGSNLGDRRENITEALQRMDKVFGRHYSALSNLIETKAMGFSGGDFLNAAVLYQLPRTTAMDILDKIKEIERSMGRTDPPEYDKEGNRVYHSRIIDIDILFYGPRRIDTPRLTIPHKGIADRHFVLIPLREIARPSLRKAFPEYF